MDAQPRAGERLRNGARDLLDFPRHRAAVSLAQHQHRRAAVERRLQRLERVLGTELVAVEEVLGVVDHFTPVRGQKGKTLADDAQVFFRCGADHLGHMQQRRFADHGADGGLGVEQREDVRVVVGRASHAAGHAKRGDFGVRQSEILRTLEVGGVLGVGAGPAAFDVGHTEVVQKLRDPELVVHRKGDVFALRAVAERRVVDFYRVHDLPLSLNVNG